MDDGVAVEVAEDIVRVHEIATASGHRIGHATLNAPATLNALSLAMIDRLASAFDRWLDDPQVAAIVLDGAGDKAFCAGGDVQALYRSIHGAAPGDVPTYAADFFEREYRLDYRIHRASKPIVCWGHGIVMGGGIGLLAGASHRVVTPKTRMAMPEISIGFYPDVGGTWFLQRAPGRVGLFLALTGASINAADARFAGLADYVLDHDAKASVLDAIGAAGWSADARTNRATLSRLLDERRSLAPIPASPVRAHLDLIDEAIGHDGVDAMASRLIALTAQADPWLASAATNFAKGSPTSAVLIREIVERARHLSLADVFRLEYQTSVGCCLHHDFAEGVRALLIDKDRNPRWQPARLADVDEAVIAAHFAPAHRGAHPLADLH